MQHSLNHATISPPPPQFSANKRRNGLVGAVLATTLTAGIGSAVAENRPLTERFRDSLIDFFRTTARAADGAIAADLMAVIDGGVDNLEGGDGIDNQPHTGCDASIGSNRARDCITAVAEEFSDLYIIGGSIAGAVAALNAELSKTGETVNIASTDAAVITPEVREAVLAYYLQENPVPSADDDDDDAPWAEAIGGAIVLSYFANYLIKQTTWQGNLFTYAMPTSDDTFAYGVQFEPNEDWQMRFSVADSSYAETPADPYYRMQVEYRF